MRIGVLGPIEVVRDGAPLPIGGPQQRRLLALLVVHRGQAVSDDRIVDALWPDGDVPEGASRSVRTYLSRLRSALPGAVIERSAAGYALRLDGSDATLDVEEFERCLDRAAGQPPDRAVEIYDRALDLWRGPPFGELADEWWILPDTARLVERHHAVEEDRAAALAVLGSHAEAVAELGRLTTERPHRERPVHLLMWALSMSGRQAEALRAARSFRRRLADETGLEPSTRFDEIESAVAAGVDPPGIGWPLRGYTLRRLLERGRHSCVYAATQPGTQLDVAVRVMEPAVADDPEFVRRFEADARVVADLDHPHVVPLLDHWREPGNAYLVTALLRGESLREAVAESGGWDLPRVAQLIEDLAAALGSLPAGRPSIGLDAGTVLLDEHGVTRLTDVRIGGRDEDLPALPVALARLAREALTGRRPGGDAPADEVELDASVIDCLEQAEAGSFDSVEEFVASWCVAVTPDGIAGAGRRGSVVNPYQGLRAFDTADARSFHGREETVAEIERRLDARRFVAVLGPSGAGKSSVVRAGLVPRLTASDAVAITMTPGTDALAALGDAVRTVATSGDVVIDGGSERSVVHDELLAVSRTLGDVVVIVDQFEECWTHCGNEAREEFLGLLTSVTASAEVDVRVVVTLRSDFLDRPLEDPMVGGYLGAGAVVVGPMSPSQLRAAIERPAEDVGVRFEPEVVDELVAAAAGQHGFLPLLQFTLTEMFDHRDGDTITTTTVASVGGVAGAVGRRAEDEYQVLDHTTQLDARELFGRLVVPGEGAPDARRRARRSELSPASVAIAEHFVAGRLLVVDREAGSREPTFEVAHEILFRSWPRLRGWIDEDRAWLLQRQQLDRAAELWDDAGRPDSDLYRGARLDGVVEALVAGDRAVSDRSREFVEAGRQLRDDESATERRRVRRLRLVAVLTSILAVVAVILGATAIVQRDEARRAEGDADTASREAELEADAARAAEADAAAARSDAEAEAEAAVAAEADAAASGRKAQIEALVGRSQALRSTQRELAALLAVEAHRLEDSPQTRSALFGTFTDDERYLDTHRLPGTGGRSGIVLPGEQSAYATDEDGRLHEYFPESGELGPALPVIGPTGIDQRSVLASSEDGDRLLQATRSDQQVGPTTVGIVEVESRRLEFEPVEVDAVVTSAVFLPDGRVALATGEAGRVIVIDARTGATTGELSALEDVEPDRIVWTPDPGSATSTQPLRRPSAVAFDGESLLVGSADGSIRVVDPSDLTTLRTVTVAPESASVLVPIDGTVIAAGRQGVSRVRLDDGSTIWAISELDGCSRVLVAVERSGVFCGGSYGRVDELDLDSGGVRRRLDAQSGISGSLWSWGSGTELVRFDDSEPIVSRWRIDGSGPITRVTSSGYWPSDFDPAGERLLLTPYGVNGEASVGAFIDLDRPDSVIPVDGLAVPGWSGENELFGGAQVGGGFEFARGAVGDDGVTVTATGVAVADVGFISGVSLEAGKQRSLIRYLDGDAGETWLVTVDPRTLELGARIDVTGLVSWSIDRAGGRVVVGTSDGVAVYASDTGDLVARLADPTLLTAAVTTTDQLLVGSLGGGIALRDLDTLERLTVFSGGPGLMLSGSGTSDGRLVATANSDGTVSLHDTATGIRLGDPIDMPREMTSLSPFYVPRLSPDGSLLALRSGYDPSVVTTELWSLDPAGWVEAACALAGRNLTPDEWDTHVGDLAPFGATCPAHPLDR